MQIATGLDDFGSALDDIQELDASGIPVNADLEELARNLKHIRAGIEADWDRWVPCGIPPIPHPRPGAGGFLLRAYAFRYTLCTPCLYCVAAHTEAYLSSSSQLPLDFDLICALQES